MTRLSVLDLCYLDQYLQDRASLNHLRSILDKVEKCCLSLDRKLNLAEVLEDQGNSKSLRNLFGEEGFVTGIQLILKLALNEYRSGSFVVDQSIEGKKRLDFLYHSIGGWKQFDMVLCLLNTISGFPVGKGIEPKAIQLVNPKNKDHWQSLGQIPSGTLVTFYIKSALGKRSINQEDLAVERCKAVFSVVQSRSDLEEQRPAPTAVIHPGKSAPNPKSALPASHTFFSRHKKAVASVGPLSMSFQVIINKMDTFVHAGNAHLITTHLKNYSGRVEMFILRGGNKVPLALDPDSIWSAEVRNGETVVYEFYGPKPKDEFLKELGSKTNKYTQMDKLADE